MSGRNGSSKSGEQIVDYPHQVFCRLLKQSFWSLNMSSFSVDRPLQCSIHKSKIFDVWKLEVLFISLSEKQKNSDGQI